MSKEIFVKLMNGLGKIYDREIDKETLEIWLSFFSDNTTNEFKEAINQHIKTSSKFPTIADIKNLIAENKIKDKPQAEDEWNKVLDLVHKYGQSKQEEAFKEMNDYTRYIVKHVGFVNICMADSEQQKWNKKEFVEEYNILKNKQRELIQIDNKEIKLFELKEVNNE